MCIRENNDSEAHFGAWFKTDASLQVEDAR